MSVDYHHYNCAGYVLGIKEWIEFDSFCDGDFNGTIKNMLDDMAGEIADRFHPINIIDDPNAIPKEKQVIGMRVAVNGRDNVEDFHFVIRKGGRWYHKAGWQRIRVMKREEVFKPWPRWSNIKYNSEIIWFTLA